MSDDAFPFATTAEVLMVLSVADALKAIARPKCPAFRDVFLERATPPTTRLRGHGPCLLICVGWC